MCMGKTPKAAKPPAAPPPAPSQEEVTSLKFNEKDQEADSAENSIAAKRRGRKALRIDRAGVSNSGLNIPG